MGISLVINLLGGLSLFLYGMQMMSNNLESVAGNRMKDILEKLTSNRFLGVLVGAGITAVIQSSSATTVMVVGFVNSGLMTLKQAVWIIMGANIGTTITGQLIALDIGVIAPLIAFIGVALVVFLKNKKIQHIGGIVAGLGILFIGMEMMSTSMMPLRESQTFINLMTRFSNPFLGILAGAAFTAIIQSSSASVGILQALAMSGLIGLDGAVYVLFGQNIGTCITAVLASIGTNRNAKRTTIIHLMFNVIGTTIFVIICMVTPFTDFILKLVPNNAAAQIADVHTIFNITTTLLLLPFGNWLAKAAVRILPDKAEDTSEVDKWYEQFTSNNRNFGVSTIAIDSLKKDIKSMMDLAYQNVESGFSAIENKYNKKVAVIEETEEKIDKLNVNISQKISKVLTMELSERDVENVNHMFNIIGNIERIGDHAMNLCEYSKLLKEKNLVLSEGALDEVGKMKEICLRALNILNDDSNEDKKAILDKEIELEQVMDDTSAIYRKNQMNRMKNKFCNAETAIIYSEMITDYERIGDHILNIAQAL